MYVSNATFPATNPVNVLFNKTICSSLNDYDCYNDTLNNYTNAQIRSAPLALQIPSNITSLDSTFIPPSPLESQKTKKLNTLKVLHINAQSLLPKIPELRLLVEESKYDCISVSETWLNLNRNLTFLVLTYLEMIVKTNPMEGLLYASSSLSPIVISASFKTETISVKVKLKSKSILIVSLYRPPRACAAYFDDILQDLEIAHSLNPNMIIMGDINFDALTDNGHSKVTEIETSFLLKYS